MPELDGTKMERPALVVHPGITVIVNEKVLPGTVFLVDLAQIRTEDLRA